MLVSVVVPMYNCEDTIRNTLASIMKQTYSNFEVILVDDGSVDATAGIALGFAEQYPNVHYYYKENGGVGEARNFGIGKSKGEFIAFCDHDDLWDESKLEKQVPLFSSSRVGLVYTGCVYTDYNRTWMPKSMNAYHEGDCYNKLLASNFIPASSVMVRRSTIESCGMFNPRREMSGSEDRHMWLCIAKRYELRVVPELLITYCINGHNYSMREEKMLQATLTCLDDILRQFPETGAKGRRLTDSIHYEVYSHYGRNLFNQDLFLSARKCFAKALTYQCIHPSIWVYYMFTFVPYQLLKCVRAINTPVHVFLRRSEEK
jgi:glycosyltransferase involved in cell wall biosynthesis